MNKISNRFDKGEKQKTLILELLSDKIKDQKFDRYNHRQVVMMVYFR